MWLDAIALLVLGFFVGVGALRGGLASGLGLLSLGVAYGSAIAAAPRFGPTLAAGFGLPPLLGLPIAGTLAFVVAYVAMAVVSALARRWERRARQGEPRSARDRFLGGSFGALRGVLVVLLISWLALWLDALRATGTVEALPDIAGSRAAHVTGVVVEAGVGAALGDDGSGGRVMARMAARPGAAIADVQALLENPQIDALREDRMFWTYVENGSVDAALNRRSFIRLAADDATRQRFANLGMVEPDFAADPVLFRSAMYDVLSEVGRRVKGLRDDPELRRLLEDPQVIAMVQEGDAVGLVTHPGFRDLVARVSSE
ncbi:MAG: CvpA family protein [Myxococcota bacterium]